jgi:flagellar basal-body rod protein FlgF
MDRMIYLAMAGANTSLQRQAVVANNLANANTTGFRADLTAHRAVPVQGDGAATRVYALETTPAHSDALGPVMTTGNPLDVALSGKAWLAVQALDGTEAYTRAGSLTLDAQGQLITHGGLTVMGDGGPISVPAQAQVVIAADGTLSASVGSGRMQTLGKLKLVTPTQALQRGEDGLFRAAEGDLSADPTARLQSGALEGSNVNVVEQMVAMIAASRQFEQQMKAVAAAQDKEQQAAKLLSNQS